MSFRWRRLARRWRPRGRVGTADTTAAVVGMAATVEVAGTEDITAAAGMEETISPGIMPGRISLLRSGPGADGAYPNYYYGGFYNAPIYAPPVVEQPVVIVPQLRIELIRCR